MFKDLLTRYRILFVFLSTVGCNGNDGPRPIALPGNIKIVEISFSSGVRFALDNISFRDSDVVFEITFDEPEFSPPGPIDGKTVLANEVVDVSFSFTVDGIQSDDAAVGISTGPGDTPFLTPPLLEGDATGLLIIIFEQSPVNDIGFSFSLDLLEQEITDAATIRAFDKDNNLLGTATADAIVPEGFLFPEGSLSIASEGKLSAVEKNDHFLETENIQINTYADWE